MAIHDIYETEPRSAYSGSYIDQEMFGTFLVPSGTNALGYTRLGVGNPQTSRRLLASKIERQTYPNLNMSWMPAYIMEGYASGSFLGRAQRFVRLQTDGEVFYDTYMPNPVAIQLTNGVAPLGFSQADLGTSVPETSGSAFGILPLANPTVRAGEQQILLMFDEYPLPEDASAVSDRVWVSTFPFQSRYKLVERLFKFSKFLPSSFSLTASWGGSTLSPASSSNVFGYISKRVLNAALGDSREVLLGYVNWPTYAWPPTSTGDHDLTYGTATDRDLYTLFFGTGDGNRISSTIYTTRGPSLKPITGVSTLTFNFTVNARGFKYGIKNVQPESTAMVYRAGKFGQVRDMLEQRPVCKFRQGTRTVFSPVVVRFMTSSLVYSQSLDYLTATNPSYNPRDSGAWDYEYKSGQPFFDLDALD